MESQNDGITGSQRFLVRYRRTYVLKKERRRTREREKIEWNRERVREGEGKRETVCKSSPLKFFCRSRL